MKTYKKPVSNLIVLDTEEVMQMMGASGAIEGATPGTSSSETNLGYGGDAGDGMEAHSKGFDSWE